MLAVVLELPEARLEPPVGHIEESADDSQRADHEERLVPSTLMSKNDGRPHKASGYLCTVEHDGSSRRYPK